MKFGSEFEAWAESSAVLFVKSKQEVVLFRAK